MKEESEANGEIVRIEEYDICAIQSSLNLIAIAFYTAKRERRIIAPFIFHEAMPLMENIWHLDIMPEIKLIDDLKIYRYRLLEDIEKLFHFKWNSLLISALNDSGRFMANLCIDRDDDLQGIRIELHDGLALVLKNKLPVYVFEGVFDRYEQNTQTRPRWYNLKDDSAWDTLRTMDTESLRTYPKDELTVVMDAAHEREEYEVVAKIRELLNATGEGNADNASGKTEKT
jgi:bifunctional DNase/RNase